MSKTLALAAALFAVASPASAAIIGVAGPNSSAGTAPVIVAAPAHALDDIVTNTGMEGFNEAQGVLTSVVHGLDGGGSIPVGTRVDSHMIFLNSQGSAFLSHGNVIWTFDGTILGVMSDVGGTLEAASTFELGAPGTNYTVTFGGSGPAAPFANRGMEGADSYTILGPNMLQVTMSVTEPGDWIRVVTATPIPAPASLALFITAVAGLAMLARRHAVGLIRGATPSPRQA